MISMIQVRAPSASVSVVGTHMDEFKKQEKQYERLCEEYRNRILYDFGTAVTNDRFFPQIKKVVFVGFPSDSLFFSSQPRYDELNDAIYDTALTMEVPRSE